jgi:predicted nucleic acid-binding protein
MEIKNLIEKIMAKSELGEDEVLHNIKVKQKEYQDLINDQAAAHLIATELGITISEVAEVQYIPLAQIQQQKITEANFIARVMNINSPKNFETEKKKGRVCNIEIADSSGRALIVLWDEDVWLLEKNLVERDDVLLITSATVKTFNPLELHSSLLTEIQSMKPQEFANSKYYLPLPTQQVRQANADSLKDGEIIDLFGRITQIADVREFQREKRIGKVLNLLIADSEGKSIPLALWDYYADFASRHAKVGNAIKIENAQVKKGLAGFELQTSWASHIVLEPKSHSLKTAEEMLKESIPNIRLLDMKAGERGIAKTVVSKINKVELASGTLRVEAELKDEINIHVLFTGRQALEILQMRNLPKLPMDLVLKLKEDYLKGKRLTLIVRKEKDRTGTHSKFYCEHILNFI